MRATDTPLTGLETDAFERIRRRATRTDGELTRTEVLGVIDEEDTEDAAHLLERLLLKGYLYEVDGVVRVT
ncbi:hypothetical protein SAMN04487948_102478 [Halogranum amylolyticum]|uniref:Uncharacterized protein n=1 Tax=Halogranum amylolyticum TaxID=660520 RepID=A0A1H8PSW5_9EURY|nr:hypothetical protein [Halogranum amylolyticum]SEO45099.1 hypothetical protein SAMN04487948_102478 [Halogranum amylolyticum]